MIVVRSPSASPTRPAGAVVQQRHHSAGRLSLTLAGSYSISIIESNSGISPNATAEVSSVKISTCHSRIGGGAGISEADDESCGRKAAHESDLQAVSPTRSVTGIKNDCRSQPIEIMPLTMSTAHLR
jgi:hypothetical protein